MPRLRLTDLTLQNLKTEKQTRFMDSAMPGFGVLCSKRKKTFILIQGKDRRLTTIGHYPALTLKEARARALTLSEGPNTSAATITELFQDFERLHLPKVSPRVQSEWKRLIKRFLHLKRPTPRELFEIIETLSPSEANHSVVALNRLYSWAHSTHRISEIIKLRKPHKEQERERILSHEELQAVLSTAFNAGKYGAMLWLITLTACRLNEIVNLTPEMVQDDHILWTTTKNGKPHKLPVTGTIREVLNIYFEYREPLHNFDRYKKNLQELSDTSGWTHHDLRRTAASILAAPPISTPPHILDRVLNHVPQGVGRIYNRYDYQAEVRQYLLQYHQFPASLALERPESSA